MKKLLLLLSLVLLLSISVNNTFAVNLKTPKIESIYNKFIIKLEKKVSWEKEINYLEELNDKLYNYLAKKKFSNSKKNLIYDIIKLDNEKIFEIRFKKLNNNNNNSQIIKELLYKKTFSKEIIKANIPSYINTIITNSKPLTTTNSKHEFLENNIIKKYSFSKYFFIDSKNYKAFLDKQWHIINISWTNTYKFVENYTIEEKIPYSKLDSYFKVFFNQNTNLFLENDNYYSYNYWDYNYINEGYWLYISDLKRLFWDLKTILLYKNEDWNYNFIKEYKKVKLVNKDIAFWVTDKLRFLEYVKYDKKDLINSTDDLFIDLKNETIKLTAWLKKQDKINKIYSWVLKNIEYPESFSLEDKKIFSGILTYRNKSWVCNWYTKVFSYMLMFAWVNDSEMIKWYVIDAKDFPDIWHAWTRIGDDYYDPTFDDPIWQSETKEINKYKFYKLPYDLFYTNRYIYWRLPENLKTKTMEYRKNLIKKNLSKLVSKYTNSSYILLNSSKFRDKYKIKYYEVITVDNLKDIMKYAEVDNFVFSYDSKDNRIKKIDYYIIKEDNTETLLEEFNYDVEDLYLFKWKLEDWGFEYRLAFHLEL